MFSACSLLNPVLGRLLKDNDDAVVDRPLCVSAAGVHRSGVIHATIRVVSDSDCGSRTSDSLPSFCLSLSSGFWNIRFRRSQDFMLDSLV